MKQGDFIIGTASAGEVIKALTGKGAEVVGDRDTTVVYLKNIQNEEDLKAVVHYENNYFDYDSDFPESPKVQVMIGDPRNRQCFVTSARSAKEEVENLIENGYEEFGFSKSKDVDIYIPSSVSGVSGRMVTITDQVVGDEDRADEYPYSISATILEDRGNSEGSNSTPWTIEDVKTVLEKALEKPVVINTTNKELVTAFDILELIAEEDSSSNA